jgi:phosphoglycerate-specific signal transduction histidine kinase
VIKLSIDDLIKLYKLASIGKLVGGLIHNINGPMQNLGLDIEMAFYSLKDESKWDQSTVKTIISRLKRMEEEHDKINSLIRATSARAEDKYDPDNSSVSNINEFIKQELSYLHTNLYFKHNVQKEIINADDPPLISSLARGSLVALGWFLQSLVEELESQKIGGLTVKIISDNSKLKILFSTKGGRLSQVFIRQLKYAVSSKDSVKPEGMEMGIFLALSIFKYEGVSLECNVESSSSDLEIDFPNLQHQEKTDR